MGEHPEELGQEWSNSTLISRLKFERSYFRYVAVGSPQACAQHSTFLFFLLFFFFANAEGTKKLPQSHFVLMMQTVSQALSV